MTSQNSGDEYSTLPSDTKSRADSVDGLDQSKSKVSNKPQQTSISLVPRIKISLVPRINVTKNRKCRIFRLIVPNPFKEILSIFRIQAPNMMHTIIAFVRSIITPDRNVSLAPLIISWNAASCDTVVISRIDFRHDHCK